jgi:hypothetical protein
LIAQALGKDRTIRESLAAILDRQVPDPRVVRAEASGKNEA